MPMYDPHHLVYVCAYLCGLLPLLADANAGGESKINGLVVGAAVGGALVVIILAVSAVLWAYRRRQQQVAPAAGPAAP